MTLICDETRTGEPLITTTGDTNVIYNYVSIFFPFFLFAIDMEPPNVHLWDPCSLLSFWWLFCSHGSYTKSISIVLFFEVCPLSECPLLEVPTLAG